jgi:pilus assembly protein CpaC
MTKLNKIGRATVGTALAAALAASFAASAPTPAMAQGAAVAPAHDLTLSVGAGQMVRLDTPMSDVFVASDTIADVQVRSANQIYIFGRSAGQTTVYATNAAGRVVYSANVRVGTNLGSVDQLLQMAMPEAQIRATPMNGVVLLTGTVAAPTDVEEAQRIVQAFVGEGTQVISRLRTATPLQVNLQVRIVEVNRTLLRTIGTNILTHESGGTGAVGGIFRGNAGTITDILSDTFTDPRTGNPLVVGTDYNIATPANTTTFGLAGRLLGVNVLATLNANEQRGLVTTLAEPNLTALSGETASFLAGGEFPIPTAQGISGTAIEFKPFGVSLAFTPTVLASGRISMRVRPEVSEISTDNAVRLNGFDVPSLVTRRAETTVELGSGQSFMIAGLLRNSAQNSVDRVPLLGRLPIIGALFRSQGFRRNETELVIIITPYLVRPVNARDIALPTDGYRIPNDVEQHLLGQDQASRPGGPRPGPVAGPPTVVAPGVDRIGAAVPQPAPGPAPVRQAQRPAALPPQPAGAASAAPGFNF